MNDRPAGVVASKEVARYRRDPLVEVEHARAELTAALEDAGDE